MATDRQGSVTPAMQKTLRVNSFFIPSDVFSAQCKILIYIDKLGRFRMKVDPHVM